MPFSGYRDIIQRRDRRLDTRQERRRQWRAVIVDSQGNQSGNGDIWADENARRLWVMPVGGGQPYQVLCVRIGRPVIGLGVIVGYAEGSNTQEVLRDDYEFLGPSNVGISWMSPSDTDFQPGGRMQLWIQTKMIQPLATYPVSGLIVGVVGGDYPYENVRTTYAGTTSQDLTASQPAAGQHRLVGLYLDANNTLQTINGTAVAVAATPPEPSWPAGAFRLSVVRIANPQTSIAFLSETNPLNDVFDRRMPWADVDSFRSWPWAGVLTVSSTDPDADYSTIAAAHTAASANQTIWVDSETYAEALTFTKALQLRGQGQAVSQITGQFTTSAALRLIDIFFNVSSGTLAVEVTGGSQTYFNSRIQQVGGVDPKALKISTGGIGTHQLVLCRVTCSAGSGTRIGLSVEASGTSVEIFGGYYSGTTYDLSVAAGCTVRLYGPILANGTISNAGTVIGHYYDTDGNLYFADGYGVINQIWLHDVSAGLKKRFSTLALALAAADTGDTIEFDGTQTITANFDLNKAVTLQGTNPETSIINTSTNSLTAITMSAAGACCRNFKVTNSGAGSGGAGIFWTASSVILEDLIISVTGAGTTNYGIGPSGAVTGTVKNCTVTVSGGTSNYGFAAVVGNSTTEVIGCKFSGSTFDVYGTVAGATLTTYNTILANGKVSFDGVYPRQSVQPTPTPPILINGHPLVWQRGTSFAAAADGTYFADRFGYFKSGAMVHTLSRDTSVPTVAQIGSLFSYSMLVDCTTADGTIDAGDYTFIRQTLEGYDWLQLAQQQWTIPFWVSATKTGIYCFSVVNSGSDRSYVAEYTVAAADTWEYKQVTVAASPSAGTWDYAAGAGARLNWALAAGSTYQTTAGAWQTGGFLATSNQVNACDDAANNFRLIVGNPVIGPYARPIVPNAFGSQEALLARCQRYAWVTDATSQTVDPFTGSKASTTIVALMSKMPVVMRAAPSLTHNISGYTAGTPTTTTVGVVDYGNNAFSTLTGALTVSLISATKEMVRINAAAGTSWTGTNGQFFGMRLGPDVIMTFAPSDYS